MTAFFRTLLTVIDQIVPLPHCLLREWQIKRRIKKEARSDLDKNATIYVELDIKDLKESHRAALGLREQLQRRAQSYLMAITVATSFSIGVVGVLSRIGSAAHAPNNLDWLIKCLLFAALISFFMSAFSALRVLGPSDLYDVWLRSQIPSDLDQQKANVIRFTQLNEAYAMAFEVQLRGSYIAMRNGVAFVFLLLFVLLTSPRVLV